MKNVLKGVAALAIVAALIMIGLWMFKIAVSVLMYLIPAMLVIGIVSFFIYYIRNRKPDNKD